MKQSAARRLTGLLWGLSALAQATAAEPPRAAAGDGPEIVRFQNRGLALAGELYKPPGEGPFAAVLYNHGSAGGMLNSQASRAIGPLFANRGWVFFMPYRRGQGLSAAAGPYIADELKQARQRGGAAEAGAALARLLDTDHFDDQAAAWQWLQAQPFVRGRAIAVAGNSFGGIQALLGAARLPACAAVAASPGAQAWAGAPELQLLLKTAVRQARSPIYLFQAENDYDLEATRTLYDELQRAGKPGKLKIYPRFGTSARDGHAFAYLGSALWFDDVLDFLRQHCLP